MKGLKRELVEWLQKAMIDKVENVVVLNVEVANDGVFSLGVIWRTLAPLDETLVDPSAGTNLYAPTPNIPDKGS